MSWSIGASDHRVTHLLAFLANNITVCLCFRGQTDFELCFVLELTPLTFVSVVLQKENPFTQKSTSVPFLVHPNNGLLLVHKQERLSCKPLGHTHILLCPPGLLSFFSSESHKQWESL